MLALISKEPGTLSLTVFSLSTIPLPHLYALNCVQYTLNASMVMLLLFKEQVRNRWKVCIFLRMEVRTKCFNLRTKFLLFLLLLLRTVIQNHTSHEYFDALLDWAHDKSCSFSVAIYNFVGIPTRKNFIMAYYKLVTSVLSRCFERTIDNFYTGKLYCQRFQMT